MKDVKLSQKITESGLMLALATILSLVKIIELPFGGSITLASMLPMVILSYRYGFLWGAFSGFVFSLIQLLLGLNNLSYATSAIAVIAIIMLDYVLAFTCTAVGGVFRKMKSQTTAITLAAFLTCLIRFLSHTVSGCTVWAGVSVPTADAFLYSLIYNAAYMIPETIITVVVAIYLSSALVFSKKSIIPQKKKDVPEYSNILSIICGIISLAGVIVAAVFLFPALQNEEGVFDITGIVNVNPLSVAIPLVITAIGIAMVIVLKTTKRSPEKE
ncbi:MAG: energy-coupled thiamine transporter ThiT [Ruminococcus sp.]|nr:energy-coupled thiamine transporter ThiT [Ruminococcus sp.]